MNKTLSLILAGLLILAMAGGLAAQDEGVAITTGVDFYNRYVWRGMDIANTPSLQPAMSLGYHGVEVGVWGAYTLSNEASESDEIDFWCSYTLPFKSGQSITLIATDYYFPNAGIRFFNFNDYDAVKDDTIPDPGAHLLELGLSFTGCEKLPVSCFSTPGGKTESGVESYSSWNTKSGIVWV